MRRWFETHVGTVRFKVTALATAVVALVLVLVGIVLVVAQRELVFDGIDEALESRAADIESKLDDPDASFGFPSDEASFTQVVAVDGKVLKRSANLLRYDGPVAESPSDPGDWTRTVHDAPLDPGDAFRLLSRRVDTADGDVVIHVATQVDEIEQAADILSGLLVITIPIVTALLAVVVWWLTGRTLRPVESIRRGVAAIEGHADLDRRVPEPPTDDEIARLARTMNAMLDRVEDAQRRQQRFVADAAHELRTPLTRIRSDVEIDIAHPEAADDAATRARVLEEAVEMQSLLDDLLHLARSDAGHAGGEQAPVDVDDLVLQEARRLRDRGQVDVDVHAVSAAQTTGDPGQLARVLRNLADNAERHAHSIVRFGLAEDGGDLVLVVDDDGPGIAPEDRERIFERFTRLDEARARDDGGTGLGLAIAQEIVARHGGSIAAVDPDAADGGARFVVRLPSTNGSPR